MIYRELGKTGYKVSQLGFGAMRLPMTEVNGVQVVDRELAIPMIHRAFEAGVNYIDTAVGYCNEDSQRVVGEALKGWRDKIVVSTKNHYYGEDEAAWWTNLENSLQRLDVEYIDIYNHHGINWDRYVNAVEPRISKWMQKAKDQGLIKHICTSFHDTNEALMKLIDTGYFESITLQYNLLNRDLEEGIAYAKAKGVGVVVMGPVAGGRLGVRSEVLANLIPGISRVPELALRFVLSNPNVTVALSGMSTMQMVEENVAIAADTVSLTEEDKAIIREHVARLAEMAKLYCTGCKYCQPCPQEVNIPHIFELYNLGQVYGLWEYAKNDYATFPNSPWIGGKQADACIECGECETKCPQNIQIREQLKAAHAALTA
ncbi:MAG TPA: aldo/keto reductase [Anaerolineae bacterium]|nr:aldo/keto reductase [Anaerolineae bacterium]HQK14759.1 aldo/keto reductase [Anaerolineae bacterium]